MQSYLAEKSILGKLQIKIVKSRQIKCWCLVRVENKNSQGKTSPSGIENHQTQPIYRIQSGLTHETHRWKAHRHCLRYIENIQPELTLLKSTHHCTASAEVQNPKSLVLKNHLGQQQCIVPSQLCQHEGQVHQNYKQFHLMQRYQRGDHCQFYSPQQVVKYQVMNQNGETLLIIIIMYCIS